MDRVHVVGGCAIAGLGLRLRLRNFRHRRLGYEELHIAGLHAQRPGHFLHGHALRQHLLDDPALDERVGLAGSFGRPGCGVRRLPAASWCGPSVALAARPVPFHRRRGRVDFRRPTPARIRHPGVLLLEAVDPGSASSVSNRVFTPPPVCSRTPTVMLPSGIPASSSASAFRTCGFLGGDSSA